MTVVLYLLALSLVLGAAGLAVFMWSLRTGQYEDMEGAANRILFDDPPSGEGGAPAGRTTLGLDHPRHRTEPDLIPPEIRDQLAKLSPSSQ